MNLKRFGRWHSSAVAEQYIADSGRIKKALSKVLLCPFASSLMDNGGGEQELDPEVDPFVLHPGSPKPFVADSVSEDEVEVLSSRMDVDDGSESEPPDWSLPDEEMIASIVPGVVRIKAEPTEVYGSFSASPHTDQVVEAQSMESAPLVHPLAEGPTDEDLLELLRALQENATKAKECFAGQVDESPHTANSSKPVLPVLDRTKLTIKATTRYLSAGTEPARGD